jgi:hypothetical protein
MSKKSTRINKEEPKNNDMVNFYQLKEVQKLNPSYYEPSYKNALIKYNSRIGVIGASGSGKSQWLLNLIAQSPDTFGHIFICHKMDEPLYTFLEKRIGDKNITFYKKLSEVPQPKDLPHQDKQKLLVFDDIVNDKDQSIVCEYFLRARKLNNGLTMCYLAQSYMKMPIFVRHQLNYLILLKIASDADFKRIVANYSIGIDAKQLLELYKDAIKPRPNFLKIDIGANSVNKKFSKNWTDFYILSDESDDETENN